MKPLVFPEKFLWGAATSAYQIEGAVLEGGRGESIWDHFSHTPGKVLNGDTGDIACDHYRRYEQDIALMKELGIESYRFSTAWPRIFPDGRGKPNRKGIDFYQCLVECLLENEIEPMLTLYHWDLPQALQDRGGWNNRDTVEYFVEYAACMFDIFRDRVKLWVTQNEPMSSAYLGNALGEDAPGYTDFSLAAQISHHILLSHAKGVQAFRQSNMKDCKVGIVLNITPVTPASTSREDAQSAYLMDGVLNRWFMDPVLKGTYPDDTLEIFMGMLGAPKTKEGDMKLMAQNPLDFLGVNYYSRMVVKASDENQPFGYEQLNPEGSSYTDMDWEVYPEGLYEVLMRIKNEYGNPCVYITENGAAFKDELATDGMVKDNDRIEYLKHHLAQVHRAIQDGCSINGYYAWSLMDNFEWAYGYSKRFGLVHINYDTLERVPKESAYWYRDIIKENGF